MYIIILQPHCNSSCCCPKARTTSLAISQYENPVVTCLTSNTIEILLVEISFLFLLRTFLFLTNYK